MSAPATAVVRNASSAGLPSLLRIDIWLRRCRVARRCRGGWRTDARRGCCVADDLAAAWAEDADARPLYPLIPGGARQRELALRSGVNLVMYTLTGNYKADQVHAKDILERLTR